MQQYLIDTNYVLRYLLDDIPRQAQLVENYFKRAKNQEISITVPCLVFVELDFALTKYYQFKKHTIIEYLNNILRLSYLDIEKRGILIKALKLYSSKNISFVDALFYTQAVVENKELLTFDKKLLELNKRKK